jgi:hypothetical protein
MAFQFPYAPLMGKSSFALFQLGILIGQDEPNLANVHHNLAVKVVSQSA